LSERPANPLNDVLRLFVGIARLRNGPEDLPASTMLLVLTIAASIVPDAIQLAILPASFVGNKVALVVVLNVYVLLWFALLLQVARRRERYLQTVTAVYGSQLIIAPALVFTAWFLLTYQKDPFWQTPATMLRLAVEVWTLVVMARILRSATQWPMFVCLVLAVVCELLALLLVGALFPQPVAAAAAATLTTA
jgi:hypothetical protein